MISSHIHGQLNGELRRLRFIRSCATRSQGILQPVWEARLFFAYLIRRLVGRLVGRGPQLVVRAYGMVARAQHELS